MKNKSKKCWKEVVPKLILAVPQTFWQFLAIHYMNYLSLFSVFCGFFTLVLFFLFDWQSWINLRAGRLNSRAFSFLVNSSWSRHSNTLDKSVSRAPKAAPLSTDLFHFSSVSKRHSCGLWTFLNLPWFLKKYFQKARIFV